MNTLTSLIKPAGGADFAQICSNTQVLLISAVLMYFHLFLSRKKGEGHIYIHTYIYIYIHTYTCTSPPYIYVYLYMAKALFSAYLSGKSLL